MKNLIATVLAAIRSRPSTDRAIAGLLKATAQLEEVVAYEALAEEKAEARIHNAIVDRNDAIHRRTRAAKVAGKLHALVGG